MTHYAEPIHTLEARGNIMLEVMRDQFGLDSRLMRREIQGAHLAAIRTLAGKGIQYGALKAALVPAADRHEAGFIFDSEVAGSYWYGRDIADMYLPLLDLRSTQSVLCGDLCGNQAAVFRVLADSMVLARSFQFVHSSQLFCVYVNNLSPAALERLHTGLARNASYLGYIPATYQTRAKTYLSTTLGTCFLKHRDLVLMGHEDDRADSQDVNMVGYNFSQHGYRVRSLQSVHYGLFLSFKVERAVVPGFEFDTDMSLNAISEMLIPLGDCAIRIDENKFEYLQSAKGGKLEKAGIKSLARGELAELIRAKIDASYLYSLAFDQTHATAKFNVIVEVPRDDGGHPTRFVAALQYRPEAAEIRLITLT